MGDGNYIKINRKMLEWEWYKNEHTKNLFLHCLLRANWKEGKFEGKTIPRGSFVSSIRILAEETALTEREIRTAISHLKSTGELTSKGHNKYSVFTVVNYNSYQTNDTQSDKQETGKRQSNDKLTTTIEEGKKERRKESKKVNNIMVSKDTICPEVEESTPGSSLIYLPLVDGSFYEVLEGKIQKWTAAYPAVDVSQEIKRMYVWLDANPKKKKTRRGIERFIVGWLERTQNNGGNNNRQKANGDFIEDLKGWMQSE